MGKNVELEKLAKKIELENEKFNSSTDAEKRVIIAQDCIDRINMGNFVPTCLIFLDVVILKYASDEAKDNNVKNLINKTDIICEGCAKGGLFLSYIGRVNNVLLNDVDRCNNQDDNNHRKLLEIFSLEQLVLIETAYEGRSYIGEELISEWETDKALEFHCKPEFWNNDEDILIEICKNIIKNDGTFIP